MSPRDRTAFSQPVASGRSGLLSSRPPLMNPGIAIGLRIPPASRHQKSSGMSQQYAPAKNAADARMINTMPSLREVMRRR